MLKKDRAALVLQRLNEHYPETPIPLDHSDPFTLLIAVLLSAQCTDKKVNEVTPGLFAAAPTPQAMAQLSEEQIHSFIRQLGLARTKAKNVRRLAQILLDSHQGQVQVALTPSKLYPASDTNGQCGDGAGIRRSSISVDTHIHRLAQRWGLTDGSNVARTETDLKRLFPKDQRNRLHLQIIYYGREHCTARGCDGRVCPLCRELYPNRRKPVITRKP